jgi:hypothetical protein
MNNIKAKTDAQNDEIDRLLTIMLTNQVTIKAPRYYPVHF